MNIPLRRVRGLTPTIYEGAAGNFSGTSLTSDCKVHVQGVIVKIQDGPRWAIVHVRTQHGTVLIKV